MSIVYKRGGFNYTDDRSFQKKVDKTLHELVDHVNTLDKSGNHLNYMGEWVEDNEYYVNDLVELEGAKYLCIKDIEVSNVSPNVDTEHFTPMTDIYALIDSIEINNVPAESTQGTLTDDQINYLLANQKAYIMFNHEKYYIQDLGHTEGFITYTHLGFENGVFNLKAITITIETNGWVLNTATVSN